MQNSRGFTLIEALVVMAIFAFAAGFALFFSMESYRGYAFRSEVTLTLSLFQKARSRAISNINERQHGVFIDTANNQYVLFEGPTPTSFPSSNISVPFISSNSSVTHGGMSQVVFNQLTGSITSVPTALTLQDGIGHSASISVNSEGRIDNP